MFEEIAQALRVWPNKIELQNPTQAQKRLSQVLNSPANANDDAADVISLILQVLREEEGKTRAHHSKNEDIREQKKEPLLLKVPRSARWPSLEQWESSGVKVIDQGDSFLVSDSLWLPEWLLGTTRVSPLSRVYRGVELRPSLKEKFLVEPKLASLAGLQHFRNEGQQAAVYRTLLMEPGATHLVILPTGTGKSLVAYLSALCNKSIGVSVFIMPTTSLALDQEERIQRFLAQSATHQGNSHPLAYHGGLDDTSKSAIKDRLRKAEQRIVITSPESVDSALKRSLLELAQQGRLNTLVVDEAHIISQWGNDFRPSFQSLSNLRDALLKIAPSPDMRLKTILLSATITPESLRTLQLFFGEKIEITAANHLRPEPSFWFAECEDQSQREKRMRDALVHIPRPWILYVTEVDAANHWYHWLRSQGVKRVEMMTGDTINGIGRFPTRESILANWRERKTDIIVATSAFGLGVDQNEVRAVVHACVPETVDRYYQEVGRAGRDGKACLSIVLWCKEDEKVAESLNRQSIISSTLGLERWSALFAKAEQDKDLLRIDLTTLPAHLLKNSKKNRQWNERTLLLLQRVGVIKLEPQLPPKDAYIQAGNNEKTNKELPDELCKYSDYVWVRILDKGIHHPQTLEKLIEPERQKIREANEKSLQQMLEMLQGTRSVGDILRDVYELSINRSLIKPEHRKVSCPFERKTSHYNQDPDLPLKIYPFPTFTREDPSRWLVKIPEKLKKQMDHNGILWVRYREIPKEGRSFWKKLQEVFELLSKRGIVEFAIDNSLPPSRYFKPEKWADFSPYPTILYHTDLSTKNNPPLQDLLQEMQLPRVSLVHKLSTTQHLPFRVEEVERTIHVVVFPEQTKETGSEHRILGDIKFTITLEKLHGDLTHGSA